VLVRRILEGVYPPGGKLPTEREMAGEFGVSRHIVREALKRLEALGMLRIEHGSGTYANDTVLVGGVELFEYLLFDEHGNFDIRILQDFFAFWVHFIPEVFRLAACQRTDEEMRELEQAVKARGEALADLPRLVETNQQFLQIIARATHNSIYQLVLNNLSRIFSKFRATVQLSQLAPVMPQDFIERVLDAMRSCDGEMAALLTIRQTEAMRNTLMAFLPSSGPILASKA
jgi:DNA-binding FadR family transcriptional regulator